MSEKISQKHLAWFVKHRSQNQKASLALNALLSNHEKKIKSSTKYMLITQTLIAINFSLWRSVFLADREDGADKRLQHAEDFLAKLIVDNAVGYPLERTAKNWTFGYYLNNAVYRLKQLAEAYPTVFSSDWEKKSRKTAQQNWEAIQGALEEGIKNFGKELAKKAGKTSS
jgi:hypothetical protein